jgi:mRNA interferase MazF
MQRGEVWWVDFEPSSGSEIRKTRPAVIVSNNMANKLLSRVQVVPLSGNIENIYPSEALVTVGAKQSKAMADQISTADKKRLKDMEGRLSDSDMKAVEKVLKIQLGLSL